MPTIAELSVEQLRRAIAIKEKIASLQKQLEKVANVSARSRSAVRPRSKVSAVTRRKMASAAKARWARIKRNKRPGPIPTNNPGTRKA